MGELYAPTCAPRLSSTRVSRFVCDPIFLLRCGGNREDARSGSSPPAPICSLCIGGHRTGDKPQRWYNGHSDRKRVWRG
jgi:hypothetical protein